MLLSFPWFQIDFPSLWLVDIRAPIWRHLGYIILETNLMQYNLHWAVDRSNRRKMLAMPILVHGCHNQQQFLALNYQNFGGYQHAEYLFLHEWFQLYSTCNLDGLFQSNAHWALPNCDIDQMQILWHEVHAFSGVRVRRTRARVQIRVRMIPGLVDINWFGNFFLKIQVYLKIDVGISKKLSDIMKIIIVDNNLANMISDFILWSFMRLKPIQQKIIINESL